eukprot:CAMPEP_0194356726 /NCGR_PEP_ID=MMETSP0174-20130528/4319_1 /TAXON_ID=216777 /ORGANISM="Proboscia alata, Strain PI-D3" /LENGTH=143 /DNA_ID=CAMNT_0039126431 /DNA_START=50 /DNA_END=481 /DNA_ORIENTATION=-
MHFTRTILLLSILTTFAEGGVVRRRGLRHVGADEDLVQISAEKILEETRILNSSGKGGKGDAPCVTQGKGGKGGKGDRKLNSRPCIIGNVIGDEAGSNPVPDGSGSTPADDVTPETSSPTSAPTKDVSNDFAGSNYISNNFLD